MRPVEHVINLAKAADAKLCESFDAPDVLPFASEAIETINRHAELRAEFEQAFYEASTYAPTEFVEVCMHALRWETVKGEYERRYRAAALSHDFRAEQIYRHYLEAFEDDWENADSFYAPYFKRAPDA